MAEETPRKIKEIKFTVKVSTEGIGTHTTEQLNGKLLSVKADPGESEIYQNFKIETEEEFLILKVNELIDRTLFYPRFPICDSLGQRAGPNEAAEPYYLNEKLTTTVVGKEGTEVSFWLRWA